MVVPSLGGVWYYFDFEVTPGREYYYVVVAHNALGDSVESNCVGFLLEEVTAEDFGTKIVWYHVAILAGVVSVAGVVGWIAWRIKKSFDGRSWARAVRIYNKPRSVSPTVAVPTVTDHGIEWSSYEGHHSAPSYQSSWTSTEVRAEGVAPVIPQRADPVVTETGWETTPPVVRKCSICGATQVDASVVFCRSCGYMIK
jgi:hypothetical protein